MLILTVTNGDYDHENDAGKVHNCQSNDAPNDDDDGGGGGCRRRRRHHRCVGDNGGMVGVGVSMTMIVIVNNDLLQKQLQ